MDRGKFRFTGLIICAGKFRFWSVVIFGAELGVVLYPACFRCFAL